MDCQQWTGLMYLELMLSGGLRRNASCSMLTYLDRPVKLRGC